MNETGKSPQTFLSTRTREKFGEKTQFHSFCSVAERASPYVAALPAAISGARGHDALFRVACVLVNGLALSDTEAWPILIEYNARCMPPWNERELRHKLSQARKVTHINPAGHLLGEGKKITPVSLPPRVLGKISLPGAAITLAPPIIADEPEACRIAGELVKLHHDGAIANADDSEANFFAHVIHRFGGTYIAR